MRITFQRTIAAMAVIGLSVSACGGVSDSDGGTTAPAGDTGTTQATEESTAGTMTESTDGATGTTTGDTMTEGTDGEGAADGDPIMIGFAIDLTANMAAFDNPALAAAQVTAEQINAAGGVDGRPIEIEVIDTALDPDQTKQAATDLLSQGADILVVTCDVDFATPAVQEGIDNGVLTVAPCIGTDQMGPQRFGDAGKLAFSFGNVAQDEGAAMAEWAADQGYKSAIVVPDNLLAYFQDVCNAFTTRWEELGGTVVATEGFASFDGSVNNIPTAVDGAGEADVIALCTFPPDIATAVGGIRDLGNDTPIISPWSGDGTFWSPEDLNGFTYLTFASVFGDDPNPDVETLVGELNAQDANLATGGFVTGSAMIETLAHAITETGSTDGATLAEYLETSPGIETISGTVKFSPELHTVAGREYRVMTFEDGTPKFQELRAATSPAIDG